MLFTLFTEAKKSAKRARRKSHFRKYSVPIKYENNFLREPNLSLISADKSFLMVAIDRW